MIGISREAKEAMKKIVKKMVFLGSMVVLFFSAISMRSSLDFFVAELQLAVYVKIWLVEFEYKLEFFLKNLNLNWNLFLSHVMRSSLYPIGTLFPRGVISKLNLQSR